MSLPPEGLALHHSASRHHNFDLIKDYHTRILGWVDIGYHFIITKQGEVLRGRSIKLQSCNGDRYVNHHYLSICCLGNFEVEGLKPKQYKRLFDFLTYLNLIFNFSYLNILGHKDVVNTLCPGKHFPLSKCVDLFKKG